MAGFPPPSTLTRASVVCLLGRRRTVKVPDGALIEIHIPSVSIAHRQLVFGLTGALLSCAIALLSPYLPRIQTNRLKKSSVLVVVRAGGLRGSRVAYEGCCTLTVITSQEGEPQKKRL